MYITSRSGGFDAVECEPLTPEEAAGYAASQRRKMRRQGPRDGKPERAAVRASTHRPRHIEESPGRQANATNDRWLKLTPLPDLLNEPPDDTKFVLDGVLPAAGLSILAAKPKVGKSTLARNLAIAVATREPFLGRVTSGGKVIYLALEEKRSEVAERFRMLGADGGPQILIHVGGGAPKDVLAELRAAIEEHRPALVVVDPLFWLVRIKDASDYAEVTSKLAPIAQLARESGCHILLLHHSPKKAKDVDQAILGSTAIFGVVDTALVMRRRGTERTIETRGRYGADIEECLLDFDEESGALTFRGTVQQIRSEEIEERVLAALSGAAKALTLGEIREMVNKKRGAVADALNNLVESGKIVCAGKGTKGDPHRYSVENQANSNPSMVLREPSQE